MGRYWWEEHKNKLYDQRKIYLQIEENRLRMKVEEERQEKEAVNEVMLLRRMPWLRTVYKARLLRIAAMEEEIDGAVCATRHSQFVR